MSCYPCTQPAWLPAVVRGIGLLGTTVSEAPGARLRPGAKHGECRARPLLFCWLPDTLNGVDMHLSSRDPLAMLLLDGVVLGGVSEKGRRGMETERLGSGQPVAILRSIQRGLQTVPWQKEPH